MSGLSSQPTPAFSAACPGAASSVPFLYLHSLPHCQQVSLLFPQSSSLQRASPHTPVAFLCLPRLEEESVYFVYTSLQLPHQWTETLSSGASIQVHPHRCAPGPAIGVLSLWLCFPCLPLPPFNWGCSLGSALCPLSPSAPSLSLPPLSLCLYFCLLPSLCSEALCGSVPFFWNNPGPTALAALPFLHPSHAPSKTRTSSGVTPHLPHVHFVCSSTSGSPAQTFLSVLIATRCRHHLFLHPALYASICRSLLKTSQLSAVSLWHSLANSPCPTVPFLAPRTGLPHIAYWPLVSLGLLTLLAQQLCQLEVFGGMNRSFWSPVLEQEQDHLVTLGK